METFIENSNVGKFMWFFVSLGFSFTFYCIRYLSFQFFLGATHSRRHQSWSPFFIYVFSLFSLSCAISNSLSVWNFSTPKTLYATLCLFLFSSFLKFYIFLFLRKCRIFKEPIDIFSWEYLNLKNALRYFQNSYSQNIENMSFIFSDRILKHKTYFASIRKYFFFFIFNSTLDI